MVDRLDNKLRNIEVALGGAETRPESYYKADDKLEWHLDYIEKLIEEGGSKPSSENQFDYIQIKKSGSSTTDAVLMFEKGVLDRSDVIEGFNQVINYLNSTFSLSIPSYTGLDSIKNIADYVNVLDSNYATVRTIVYSGFLSALHFWLYSIKITYNNGDFRWSTSGVLETTVDTENNNYGYTINYLDPELDTFNWQSFVNSTDDSRLLFFINDFD